MLNCLQVFALGGRSDRDDARGSGYYAIRAALSKAVFRSRSVHLQTGTDRQGAPVLVRFISAIAARFGIVVSEKAAAAGVPAIGAIGGGLINTIFMDHFQNIAQAHFAIRGLERRYGVDLVRAEYERLPG